MEPSLKRRCYTCGGVGFDDSEDGFFYCRQCGTQADDIIATGVAEEDLVANEPGGAIYLASHRRSSRPAVKEELFSQSQPDGYQSQLLQALNLSDDEKNNHPSSSRNVKKEEELFDEYDDFVDTFGPTEPSDFGSNLDGSRDPSFEDYYNAVRSRYVTGVQFMIQFQCRALVEKFGATPLICGLAGTLWLRFLAISRVFDDGWADEAIQESEMQKSGSQFRVLWKVTGYDKFSSYQELRSELVRMFGLEGQSRSGWKLIFVDRDNDILLLGDDPWQEFINCVWYIMILSPQEAQEMGLSLEIRNSPPSLQESTNLSIGNTFVGFLEY